MQLEKLDWERLTIFSIIINERRITCPLDGWGSSVFGVRVWISGGIGLGVGGGLRVGLGQRQGHDEGEDLGGANSLFV